MTTLAPLSERWAALRGTDPRLRVREAANRLGVSEGELVASWAADGVVRLRADWTALIPAFGELGEVMALTRNDHCVHERHGAYRDIRLHGRVGLVLGEDIDLRLFLDCWRHAFHVPAGLAGSPRGSIQIFDPAGQAVHKIFATEATPEGVFPALAARFAIEPAAIEPEALPAEPDRPDVEVDAAALRTAWAGLRDTHDFFPMLRRQKVGRVQALRLAGAEWAQPLSPAAPRQVLEQAAAAALPIMIFVGNPGCVQIHTGRVERLKPVGSWFNVLDPRFNLHLSEPGVVSAWRVRKPTDDGIVTSVECFDAEGRAVAMMFGKRKPGTPEDPDWRELAGTLA